MTFTRQTTSKEILKLDWHFPISSTFKQQAGDGRTVASEYALPREEAFVHINGKGNKKPLLVLRECVLCKGTDHALFDRRLANEKTKLLCEWFYCVKLPPRVLDKKHAFRHLFAKKKPPHVFICSHDGKDLTEFDGLQSQTQLQAAMVKLIESAYEKKPLPAVKSMLRFLSRFDTHDAMLLELTNRMQKEMLREKPRKSSLAKLKSKIALHTKKRDTAMKHAKAVCDLKLAVDKEPKSKGRKAAVPAKAGDA